MMLKGKADFHLKDYMKSMKHGNNQTENKWCQVGKATEGKIEEAH